MIVEGVLLFKRPLRPVEAFERYRNEENPRETADIIIAGQ